MKKKHTTKSKFLIKISLFLLVITASLGLVAPSAHAGVCDDDSPVREFLYGVDVFCRVKEFNPLVSIQRTIDDGIHQMLTGSALGLMTNSSPDDFGICSGYLIYQYASNLSLDFNSCEAGVIFEEEDLEAANTAGEVLGCNFNATAFGALESRTEGSLMGVTQVAYNTVTSEPVPVNFAYYAHKNIQKIPIINQTAYAQTTQYNAWGLELILGLWSAMKNVAYAMMAVIMLVIGMMIIARKRISSQAVVTVQQALPRVIISLILITFSYTIGALFASAIIPLTFTVIRVFFGVILDRLYSDPLLPAQGNGQLIDMNVLIVIGSVLVQMLGAATLGVVMMVLLILMTLIALLVAVVKIIMINLQILISIVFAPLQFAIAAIPGQEHLITDWFKSMIAKVLAIPAMVFMIAFAWYLLIVPFLSADLFGSLLCNPEANSAATNIFTIFRHQASIGTTFLVLPLMTVMVMFYSLKAPKKIEEMIMGSKNKKR
ncbi:hypothetical protein ACFL0C_00100 [Patescibacteria group bacterium]